MLFGIITRHWISLYSVEEAFSQAIPFSFVRNVGKDLGKAFWMKDQCLLQNSVSKIFSLSPLSVFSYFSKKLKQSWSSCANLGVKTSISWEQDLLVYHLHMAIDLVEE